MRLLPNGAWAWHSRKQREAARPPMARPIALESEVEAWLEPPFGTYLRGRCGGCYVRTADGVSADFTQELQ